MSVIDGQNADAATFNAAFASKSSDNTLTGKQTLNRTGSGAQVTDVQQAINDVIAADALKIPLTQKGASNGVATLDASTLIPDAQIPSIASSKISDFNTAADARIDLQKGAASGIAPLNASTKIDSIYLPSYVDDVVEVANFAALPVTGETGKIYVTLDTNNTYRWSGSVYVKIGQPIASTDDVAEGSINQYFTSARVADKQIGIQFQDQGSNLGTSATVNTIDFIGAGITATRASNKVTVEVTATGSGGGSKNYFSQSSINPDFETGVVTPWATADFTWATNKPSGFTSPGTTFSLAPTTTNPLAGTTSMLLSKTAGVSSQYKGYISGIFTIDREDVSKILTGSFSYEVTSGASSVDFSGSSTQTLEIWIQNYSSGEWIQPAGWRGMNQSIGSGKVVFSFQTSGNTSFNQYRIAVLSQQSTTTAYTVVFDDFQIGTQAIALGSAMTDPTSYSPILTNAGNATATGSWYRLGSNVVIESTITIGSVLPSGTITISKPSNITPSMAATGLVNTAIVTGSISATGATYDGALRYDIALGTFSFLGGNGQQFWNATVPATWASGDRIRISATMQVSGWSSSSQMSSDSDTRVVAARYTTASGSTGARIQFNTQDFDTHSAVTTGASWVYQAPVSGIYEVRAYVNVGANNIGQNPLNLYKNGVSHQTLSFSGISAANSEVDGAGLVSLNAGDTIYLTVGGTAVTITGAWITINKLSGASIITATETVACRYTNSSSAISGTAATITYSTKDYDTHGIYSGGIATIPVSGKYLIVGKLSVGAVTGVVNSTTLLAVYNGATEMARNYTLQTAATTANFDLYVTTVIHCMAGDQITIKGLDNRTTPSVNPSSVRNYVEIIRVGN